MKIVPHVLGLRHVLNQVNEMPERVKEIAPGLFARVEVGIGDCRTKVTLGVTDGKEIDRQFGGSGLCLPYPISTPRSQSRRPPAWSLFGRWDRRSGCVLG